MDGHTALVAITHSPNFLGILQPAEQIGRIAHRAGAPYLLDAANTVGIAVLDVQKIGCNFLAAAGRKYLRGPAGSGFLYAAKDALKRIHPAFAAWNSGRVGMAGAGLGEAYLYTQRRRKPLRPMGSGIMRR